MKTIEKIRETLGKEASYYLDHTCKKIPANRIKEKASNPVEVFLNSDRNIQTLRSLSQLYNHGNLGGTGYLNILPIDQGIEHSAAFSFYKNLDYFDPANIIRTGYRSRL